MNRRAALKAFLATALISFASTGWASAQDGPTVGMSWANYQEERWKIDEEGLRARLEEMGGELIATDAQSSSSKQASDIENLLTRGVDVLMIVAQDAGAVMPAVQAALDEGVPVVAYERQIEHPELTYVAFDPIKVGRIQARALVEAQPSGRYALIKGSPTDQYTFYVLEGQREIIDPLIEAGDIEIVGEQFTDGWAPTNAQTNMEGILTANDNDVDAVLAANDGTAGGVVAALRAVGLDGTVPVSGQDGDIAALNRIAGGSQTVTAWKDARALGAKAADVAKALADGVDPATLDGALAWTKGPEGIEQTAVVLAPVAITRDNLEVVVNAGWIGKDELCRDLPGAAPAICE